MNILVLDDEMMALENCLEAVRKAEPEANVNGFRLVEDAMGFVKDNHIDIAFLDIRMKGYTGVDVARKLKKINPEINIIFATGYDEYRKDAFEIHASGYLTKPITPDAVRIELENLRYPVNRKKKKRISARTFGNFDLFVDGKIVEFQRSLSKELLAFLIDKRGASTNRTEIALEFFGDEDYSRKTQDYISKIIKSLSDSLKAVNAEGMLVKGHNAYSVDTTLFDCDAYDYLSGDPDAINSFYGEYMAQYIWSEDAIDKFYKD